jgi:hypothetical protein
MHLRAAHWSTKTQINKFPPEEATSNSILISEMVKQSILFHIQGYPFKVQYKLRFFKIFTKITRILPRTAHLAFFQENQIVICEFLTQAFISKSFQDILFHSSKKFSSKFASSISFPNEHDFFQEQPSSILLRLSTLPFAKFFFERSLLSLFRSKFSLSRASSRRPNRRRRATASLIRDLLNIHPGSK